jgi:hypothetical protein
VRCQQRFQPLAEGGIAEAGTIQEGGPFSAGQLDGGLKQGFLTLRGWVHILIGFVHLPHQAQFVGKKYGKFLIYFFPGFCAYEGRSL